ncbi:hypothetical protein L1887_06928 [Cichorium endivia]|nr:hypothetical protein L1887_06928 [Cichorium endivia]
MFLIDLVISSFTGSVCQPDFTCTRKLDSCNRTSDFNGSTNSIVSVRDSNCNESRLHQINRIAQLTNANFFFSTSSSIELQLSGSNCCRTYLNLHGKYSSTT